jgi:hypothetical protein
MYFEGKRPQILNRHLNDSRLAAWQEGDPRLPFRSRN